MTDLDLRARPLHCLRLLLCGLLVASICAGGARAQETPATMPIADLHFHPEYNCGPETFVSVFERSGVRWFGLGERVGGRAVAANYKKFFGERYVVFGGQSYFSGLFDKLGAAAVNSPAILEDAEFKAALPNFDKSLAAREIVGIGELFVNNGKTHPDGKRGIKLKIDGPAIRALFDLAVKYEAFLAFHMESDSDSLEQLETLAASNRAGRIILNHCGVMASAGTIDRLMSAHPNIFCEVSSRYDPTIPGVLGGAVAIFDRFTIRGGWKDVIVKHADRFMVGTDAGGQDGVYEQAIRNVRSGLLANLPPETAQAVAYGNAKRLFKLN